jgi:hypothetical protein
MSRTGNLQAAGHPSSNLSRQRHFICIFASKKVAFPIEIDCGAPISHTEDKYSGYCAERNSEEKQ